MKRSLRKRPGAKKFITDSPEHELSPDRSPPLVFAGGIRDDAMIDGDCDEDKGSSNSIVGTGKTLSNHCTPVAVWHGENAIKETLKRLSFKRSKTTNVSNVAAAGTCNEDASDPSWVYQEVKSSSVLTVVPAAAAAADTTENSQLIDEEEGPLTSSSSSLRREERPAGVMRGGGGGSQRVTARRENTRGDDDGDAQREEPSRQHPQHPSPNLQVRWLREAIERYTERPPRPATSLPRRCPASHRRRRHRPPGRSASVKSTASSPATLCGTDSGENHLDENASGWPWFPGSLRSAHSDIRPALRMASVNSDGSFSSRGAAVGISGSMSGNFSSVQSPLPVVEEEEVEYRQQRLPPSLQTTTTSSSAPGPPPPPPPPPSAPTAASPPSTDYYGLYRSPNRRAHHYFPQGETAKVTFDKLIFDAEGLPPSVGTTERGLAEWRKQQKEKTKSRKGLKRKKSKEEERRGFNSAWEIFKALSLLWTGVVIVLLFLAFLMTKLFECSSASSISSLFGFGGGETVSATTTGTKRRTEL